MKDDQFLRDFQTEPRREFSRALYQRLERQPVKSSILSNRRSLIGLAVVLALALMLVLSPPGRAFAQQVITRFSALWISNEPTYAEQYETALQNGTVHTLESPIVVEWQAPGLLSLAEAADQAGFIVSEITSLPDGFNIIIRSVNPTDELNPLLKVITVYQAGTQTLTFSQSALDPKTAPQTLPVGAATVTTITLQGVEAAWIEDLRLSTTVNDNNQVDAQYANLLVWERNGFHFEVSSTPGLALEEMLAVAQSVTP